MYLIALMLAFLYIQPSIFLHNAALPLTILLFPLLTVSSVGQHMLSASLQFPVLSEPQPLLSDKENDLHANEISPNAYKQENTSTVISNSIV